MTFDFSIPLDPSFDHDIRDLHLIYDYDATNANGKPEKWRYEMWFFSHNRIVYAIHGRPMAGRLSYQTYIYQCIRPGELWQCNWLEETGSIASLVYDIKLQQITTLIAFSKGHWENPEVAHGDKQREADFERWRGLAKVGTQSERHLLAEKATVLKTFRGRGELVPIEPDAVTL